MVSVIILSWNDAAAATNCLESVFDSHHARTGVTVVDNASEGATVAALLARFPQLNESGSELTPHTLIINERNLGFAAGCNVGLRYALDRRSDYILLLNQDTVIPPDLISTLVNIGERDPDAALWGPKTYTMSSRTEGRPRLIYTGSWRRWVPLQQSIPGIGEWDNGAYDQNRPTDYAWGHGLFMRASALDQIGLFDEDFFFYYEDIDLCRRMTDAGYQIWYVADTHLWHDVGDGARAESSELWRWRYKAHGIRHFYRKHYGVFRGTILTALTVVDMCLHMIKKGQWLASYHLGRSWLEESVSG